MNTRDVFRTFKLAQQVYRALILTIGWLFFGFVAYKVATTHLANTGLWDPYEILGVSASTTKNEIKKKFRDLSLIYHPVKVQGTDVGKEAAAKIYNDLSKARKVLTGEEA
ncbi:secretory subunit, partial [Physocladia obscura]